MPLTEKSIEELKILYQREFGVLLPDDEAWEMGHRLLRIYELALGKPENPERS